jgi:zinc transporter ZupT
VPAITYSVTQVLFAALGTAIATGLGALPFVFVRAFPRVWLGVFNAAAAGLMLGASHALMNEGATIGTARMLGGFLFGIVLVGIGFQLLRGREDVHVGDLRGADAAKALLIVATMTIHSIAEGVGVGVSFAGSEGLAAFVTTAIAIHNIPEGLAISLVLVPIGVSVWKAAGWSIFSSLPQPLFAVPAFLFVSVFAPLQPYGFGFAAGAMIFMAFGELLPDALETTPRVIVAAATSLAFAAMLAFQFYLKA